MVVKAVMKGVESSDGVEGEERENDWGCQQLVSKVLTVSTTGELRHPNETVEENREKL